MAETLPPSPDLPRPLPRAGRSRTLPARTARPRFQWLDAVWLAVLLLAAATIIDVAHVPVTPGTALATLSILTTYLLGWRTAGRACGVTAGMLLVTSPAFLGAASHSLAGSAFMLATLAALLLTVIDLPIAGCVLAAIAAVIRPDGALLGLIILALVSVRVPRQALLGAAAFFVIAGLGWAGRLLVAHQTFPAPVFQAADSPYAWACVPLSLFLLWFLVPFCADLIDPLRGARWLPTGLWLAAYILFGSFVQFAASADMAFPIRPILYAAIAGGMARLLPAVAGENPAGRYVLATLAVMGLLALHAQAEWPLH